MDLLLVGVVTKAHGLRGEVVVEPHNAASPLWTRGTLLHAVPRALADGATDRVDTTPSASWALEACRKQIAGGETRMLCVLAGVAGRDQAEALRGTHLAVEMAAVPALGDDEFYHHELRGFTVVDTAGVRLGTVVGVYPSPGQDLLEVRPMTQAKAETWFAPLVPSIVKAIDRATQTITLDPPEGLVP